MKYLKEFHVRYVWLNDGSFYDRLMNSIQVRRLFENDDKVQILYIKSLKEENVS